MTKSQRIDFILHPPHGRATRTDARLIPDQQPKPLVLFLHGFKGFKEWGYFNLLADYFARSSFVFVKLNLSHNGSTLTEDDVLDLEAFGQNNFSIELADVDALLNLFFSAACPVPATEIDLNRIFLVGHSRSGGLAILVAAQNARVKATATWTAISDLEQRWPGETLAQWRQNGVHYIQNARTKQKMFMYYQIIEDYEKNKEKLNIPAAAREMRQPLLLLHGTHDETLPLQMAYDLKNNQPAAVLEILPGVNHTFGGSHPYTEPYLPAAAQLAADKTIAFFRSV
jgi:uncharacterized protein